MRRALRLSIVLTALAALLAVFAGSWAVHPDDPQTRSDAFNLTTPGAEFSLNALSSAPTWPRATDSLTLREVDVLALRPGTVAAGALRIRPDTEPLNQVPAPPAAVLWLADNFQSVSYDVGIPGLSTQRTRQLRYQLALWLLTKSISIDEIEGSRLAPLADSAQNLADISLLQSSPVRTAVQAPTVDLQVIDKRVDGEKIQAVVEDAVSHDRLAGQLVTFYIEEAPTRVLETNNSGIAGPLALNDESQLLGTVSAAVAVPVPPGTLLASTADGAVLLTGQALGFSATSNEVTHEPVDFLDPNTMNLLVSDFLSLLPNTYRLIAGVLIVICIGMAALTGTSLGNKVARAIAVGGVTALVVVGIGFLMLRGASSTRVDASWAQPPSRPSPSLPLEAVGASATTEFYNGAYMGVYGPGCAIPGASAATGRPWLSARGAGLPQTLRIDLAQPSVISRVRLEPGWTNGQPEDFERQPRPTQVDITSDAGIVQQLDVTWAASYDSAKSAGFVDLEPFTAGHVYVTIQAVEGGAVDRGAIGEIEFAGAPLERGQLDYAPLRFLSDREARRDCNTD